ncbi:MAG: sel1 repeat family protein [Deltaproteobacteria bacterium]|jgi:TPR repeat protein|nr:sel1 repeat family protein [Deltaproteobacteria bacterium]
MAGYIFKILEGISSNYIISNNSDASVRDSGLNCGIVIKPSAGYSVDDEVALITQAAQMGLVPSMFTLGFLYHEGAKGVKKDFEKSMEWLLKAIENEYAPAMSYLGFIYYRGDGVTVNKTKAIELWNKAMALGDFISCFHLSLAYKRGDGVIQDEVIAEKLWLRYLELKERYEKEEQTKPDDEP